MEHAAAVYRLFDVRPELLYVGVAKYFGSRWKRHAWEQPWWAEVHSQSVAWYGSRAEALKAEAAAITAEGPLHNKRGSPWKLIKDEVTGFYVVPKPPGKVVYRVRKGTALEHARELAGLLSDGEGRSDPLLREALQSLTEVVRKHLAGTLGLPVALPDGPDPRQVRLGEILMQRGGQGARAGALWNLLCVEGMPVARETVSRWLAAYEQQGLAIRPAHGGRRDSNWVWASTAPPVGPHPDHTSGYRRAGG